jgi:hypothetical protein
MVPEERTTNTSKGLREAIEELKKEVELQKYDNKKPKPFTFSNKWKSPLNKSKKEIHKILLFYLNMSGVWEPPKLIPIVGGDVIVLPNLKAYEIDPRDITILDGKRAYVCREIDRRLVPVARPEATRDDYEGSIEPISNTDYEKVAELGRSTANHPTLLKAILAARAEQLTPKKKLNIGAIVIGLLIGGVVLAILMSLIPKGG